MGHNIYNPLRRATLRSRGGTVKVSIIIPTMNEEKSIGETLDRLPRDFADLDIMIVDTNSKDRTREIAVSKGARVVDEPRRGYGRAYKTGFAAAEGDVIVTLDGDTTYPPEDIPKLVKALVDEDLDFITTDRLTQMEDGAMNTTHKFGNWTLVVTMNILFRMKLKDSQSGMWVFKKDILDKLDLTSDQMALSEEIKIEAYTKGLKCKEIPIKYEVRQGEVKLNTWKDGFDNELFLFKKRFGMAKAPVEEEAVTIENADAVEEAVSIENEPISAENKIEPESN